MQVIRSRVVGIREEGCRIDRRIGLNAVPVAFPSSGRGAGATKHAGGDGL